MESIEKEAILTLTENDFDRLALDGCDMVVYRDGSVVTYDVAGYDRVPRREMSPRQTPLRKGTPQESPPLPSQARFADAPYLVRMGGFRRGDTFGPDEIGARFRELGIAYNDGLGNGLYEGLLINRKYGLRHTFEAPSKDLTKPYLEAELEAHRGEYAREVEAMQARYAELEAVYGRSLLGQDPALAVFILGNTPLWLFSLAYQREQQAVQAELQAAIGRPTPPIQPASPSDRLALIRFWNYAWRKHARLLQIRIEVMRAQIGPNLLAVGNYHELPHLDQAALGRSLDYPAVAVRPLLLEDEVLMRHYTAYWVQLVHDLSGKPPMVSLRNTLSAAGCRFVPDAAINRQWYDQAIRHGAGAFYLWTRDYPMDLDDPYDGPIPANPVGETHPEERWEANLSALGLIAAARRFLPPAAEIGILFPLQSAWLNREACRRIYSAFSAAAEARLHTIFLSDLRLEQSGVPAQTRLLLMPELEFVSPALRRALESFCARGGLLLSGGGPLADENGLPAGAIHGMQIVDGKVFDVFPLGRPASLADLAASGAQLQRWAAETQADPQAWVFDVTCENLPPAESSLLRAPELSIRFAHWLYEHGSDWIYPYIKH